ncbi:hypothetical protein [Vibrio hepatarius]|uniref:hypothetical protein n=1 Tax=Vibrio hepatarius TaxID=171383 RepID=UPI001C07F076|nr:hypothetical protein [Vibrio hepatarius]MBU2896083.1 hypothetical protein [Vibrio hepatarius]
MNSEIFEFKRKGKDGENQEVISKDNQGVITANSISDDNNGLEFDDSLEFEDIELDTESSETNTETELSIPDIELDNESPISTDIDTGDKSNFENGDEGLESVDLEFTIDAIGSVESDSDESLDLSSSDSELDFEDVELGLEVETGFNIDPSDLTETFDEDSELELEVNVDSELDDAITAEVDIHDDSFEVTSDDEYGAPSDTFEDSDIDLELGSDEGLVFDRDGKEEVFLNPEKGLEPIADSSSLDSSVSSDDEFPYNDYFLSESSDIVLNSDEDSLYNGNHHNDEFNDSEGDFGSEDSETDRDAKNAQEDVFEASDALAVAALGAAAGMGARSNKNEEAEQAKLKDKQDNVKNSKETKGKPTKQAEATKGSTGVLKVSLISSFVTSAITIGGGYFAYDLALKDSLATKDDLNYEVNRLQSSMNKSTKKEIQSMQDEYVSVEKFESIIGELRSVIDDVESISGEKATDIANSLREVKGLMATATKRLDSLENQDLVLRSDMHSAIKDISTRSVEDNTARNGIVVALKRLESLEGKFEDRINNILSENKADSGDISVKINELKVELLKEIDEVYSQADKARRMNEDLYTKYNELSKSIDSNSLPDRKERTIANALGIDVAKGSSRPVYNLSGIVNGRVFIDMDDDPKKQKIQYYNVGDYIDGYGKVTSVTKETKEVMTESGRVIFRNQN